MTRDAEHTPSPQSVVVPVELMTLSLKAAEQFIVNGIETGYVRLPDYDDDPAHSTLPLIRDALALLSVAPAPSSLAGGEVSRAVACVDQVARGAQVSEVYGGEWCLDPALEFRAHLRAILAALSPEAPAREGGAFQDRCGAWLDVCFGPESRADIPHRNARFLEEAVELVQAAGMGESAAVDVVRYVFTRPQGDINQEVGGVMMTLAAHCLATGVDMGTAAEAELMRVWTKVDAIRKKEAAKPTFAALTPRHEDPACTTCGGKGYTDHEGGDGEGYPSRPEIEDCPRCHKAPAEGAGERDPIRSVRTIMARAVERKDQETLDHARIALDALRTRSSAPEAREGEAVAWWTINVNDTVQVKLTDLGRETHKAYWEPFSAGKYQAARVDGEGWSEFQLWDLMAVFGPKIRLGMDTPFETAIRVKIHPAAPSADKLRIAVEAMQGAIEWDKRTGYRMPYRVRDPLYAAIDLSTPDALKGDAKP